MTRKEAEEIISAYRRALEKGTEGETVLRRASWLPYSKAKIKHAYFTFIEDGIRSGGLTENDRHLLVDEYSMINSFIDDITADKYAKIKEEWQTKKSDFMRNKKDEQLIKQYIYYTHSLRSSELQKEITEYIEELGKEKG